MAVSIKVIPFLFQLGNNIAFFPFLLVTLTDLSPPRATLFVRCWFFKGEPVRTAEAILAGMLKRHTDALHDLLADPFSLFLGADGLDTGIAEFLQEGVTASGAEAIHGYIVNCVMELR